jgi:DNA repair protein RecO (recombination protein O)
MPLFESESIVLKTYNLAEADRIVVFFTREYGIVRGVAKGAKRLKSRFGSTLEPFSTVMLEYFQKEDRELVGIRSVELVRSSFAAASDPRFLHTFSYIADLLAAFAPPHDPNETLYRMVKACIESGADSSEALAAIRLYFELWLLRLGGYMPDWTKCDGCKRTLSSDEDADLKADFHLLCATCRKSQGGHVMSGIHRDIVVNALRLPPREFAEYVHDKGEASADVSQVLKRIISGVIGREVASEKSFAVNF